MTGPELRARRHALGISQIALGRKLGVPQNTVSRWEIGAFAIQHPEMVDAALQLLEQTPPIRRRS